MKNETKMFNKNIVFTSLYFMILIYIFCTSINKLLIDNFLLTTMLLNSEKIGTTILLSTLGLTSIKVFSIDFVKILFVLIIIEFICFIYLAQNEIIHDVLFTLIMLKTCSIQFIINSFKVINYLFVFLFLSIIILTFVPYDTDLVISIIEILLFVLNGVYFYISLESNMINKEGYGEI